MSQICCGKFKHEKNENLDDYFKALGVPYLIRKMICSTSPQLEITSDEQGNWTVSQITMLKTTVAKFKLGEVFEENMPGGLLKSNAVLEDNKLIISSTGPNQEKVTRTYEFSESHCILTLKELKSGIEAKRHFKRSQ
ncbi:unnamed protein product [Brassicogethes aeneus]|uniref:Lipocalin/cytosolic fatty-acid binding domain-containing protein n=1 Tax=Brassicogethes aeneus TaxID=1431903 RepID=A0A9P0BAP8_BRAAE|nr:unnamed protein product [Brassicogethes aeneus]